MSPSGVHLRTLSSPYQLTVVVNLQCIIQRRINLLQLYFSSLQLIAGSAGYEGYEKVQEVIASQPGLLDDIALALDGTSLVLANWYNLAIKFSVPRKDCWKFERLSTQNPTNELFQYLESTCPQMTLKELKETLSSMRRIDLLDFLNSQSLEGN